MSNLREELILILESNHFQTKHINLIQKHIFNSPKFQSFLKKNDGNFNTNCAMAIKKGQLAFSCATCSVDKSHLICSDCFDVNLHQNHKCIITKSYGNCDCGDEQIIKSQGICQKHKPKKIDINKIINQIPINLRQNIEEFLIVVMELYIERMDKVRINLKNQSNIIIKIYHQCIKQNEKSLQQSIEQHFNVKNYYNLLQQAYFLHSLFVKTINLLANKKNNFVLLISQLIQQPQSLLSNKSIFECLYENQVILESQFPEDCQDLESLLKTFKSDLSFCKFLFNFIFWKQKHLFLFVPQMLKAKSYQELQEFYENVLQDSSHLCMEQFDGIDFFNIEVQKQKQFLLMNQSFTFGSFDSFYQDQLEFIFSNKSYQKQIKDNASWLKKIQNKILVHETLASTIADQILNIIISPNFNNVALNELKHCLGEHYENFCNVQNIDVDILMKEKREDYFLSCILNSFRIEFKEQFHLKLGKAELKTQFSDAENFIAEVSLIARNFIKAFAIMSPLLVKEAKNNLINLLIYQSYYLIKNFKNPNDNFDQKLYDRVDQFVTKLNLPKKNAINRCTLIYLKSLKQDTVIDKIFTFLLGLLYYSHDFQGSSQLLEFLSNILKEEVCNIKQQMEKILQRCLQTLLAMQFHHNKSLHTLYCQGIDSEKMIPPQTFDIAFLRIYLFCFPEDGIQHVRSCISKLNIPNRIMKEFQFESYLIEKILSSEIDMINLYGEIFTDLPSELQLSLAKILCNYEMIKKPIKCESLKEDLNTLGILTVALFNNEKSQILNVCSLDDLKVNYILNDQYKPSFDKVLVQNSPNIYNEIIDNLISKKISDYLIAFGNSTQWDVNFFSMPIHRKMLKTFLQYYSSEEAINYNLKILKEQENCCKNVCSLLYKQIVAAEYFLKESYSLKLKTIKNELELCQEILGQKLGNIEDLKALIGFVQSQFQLSASQIDEEIVKQDYIKGKRKYIEKYSSLQKQINSELIQKEQTKPNLEEEEIIQTVCQFCSQDLQSNSVFVPFCASKRKIISTLALLPDWLTNEIIMSTSETFIATSCMHQQHFNCFEKIEEELILNKGYFQCPTCQTVFDLKLPINHSLTDESFNHFIQQISNKFQFPLNDEKYYNLFNFFLLVLIDQLGQAFQNPFHYLQKSGLSFVKQILKTIQFFQTSPWDFYIFGKEKLIKSKNQESIIGQIIYLVEDSIQTKQNAQQFQFQIIEVISKCPDESMKQVLIQLFEVDNLQKQQEVNNSICNKDIIFYQGLQKSIEQQIVNILGQNFQEFHFKYFPKVCSICKFFNKVQKKNSDLFLCLLCTKILCNYQCKKLMTPTGNLNLHAQFDHCGLAFYVSLSTGNCAIVDYPISFLDSIIFFQNDQGFQNDPETNQSNWESYQLQQDAVSKLSLQFANNSYLWWTVSNQTQNMDYDGRL